MVDLKFAGLVTIGLLLAAIITAFIFSKKFREDVISSEGEASVFGMINVKGVIVVLLSAIFVGAFIYIIQMDNNNTEEIDTSAAINYLKKSSDVQYALNYNPNIHCLELMMNRTAIGKLDQNLSLNLNAEKANADNKTWQIKAGNLSLGMISLETEQGNRFWHQGQNPRFYEQNKPYQIQNMDFYFSIDSIYTRKIDTLQLPYFDVKFGEKTAGEIKWHAEKFTFNKTDNGKIDLKNDLRCLTDPAWSHDYYVGFGVGLPGGEKQTHVEMLNTFVVKVRLK